jgi:hypothetical protein
MICLEYTERCEFMDEDGQVLSEYRANNPVVRFSSNDLACMCVSNNSINLIDPYTGSVLNKKLSNGLITAHRLYDSRFISINESGGDHFDDFDLTQTSKCPGKVFCVSHDGNLIVFMTKKVKTLQIFDTRLNEFVRTLQIDGIPYTGCFSYDNTTLILYVFTGVGPYGSFLIIKGVSENWIHGISKITSFTVSPNGETILYRTAKGLIMLLNGTKKEITEHEFLQVEFIDDDTLIAMTQSELLFYNLEFVLEKTTPLPLSSDRRLSVRPRSYTILL